MIRRVIEAVRLWLQLKKFQQDHLDRFRWEPDPKTIDGIRELNRH
jgi:hypothetical protein